MNVFVGLSGGVDSALSAALLKEKGNAVTGVFIKIWQPEFIECTWKEDRLDAMRVCAGLDIPFREVDLSQEYKQDVIDTMVADYERGMTPNPDVLCNRSIKFGAFAEWARSEGADHIATGHYARIRKVADSIELLRGADAQKDQSYFLHRLGQADLAHALFPVGEFEKVRVREMARTRALAVARKADSQGLCFVGDITLRDFLLRFIQLHEGAVLEDGRRIGTHDGAALYTIGQRHGFVGASQGPYFVVAVDIAQNVVHVSKRREDAARTACSLRDVHWVGTEPSLPTRLEVQTRYRETPVLATLSIERDGRSLTFDIPHIFAAGQSAVFYESERCLGGATIA